MPPVRTLKRQLRPTLMASAASVEYSSIAHHSATILIFATAASVGKWVVAAPATRDGTAISSVLRVNTAQTASDAGVKLGPRVGQARSENGVGSRR